MSVCPDDFALVDPRMGEFINQYRESPSLQHMARTYLRKAEEAFQSVCYLPNYFDIETAIGDQLTLIGKRMGWPRCHCVCDVQPVYGIECDGVPEEYPIAGLCDETATWVDCGEFGLGEICINDDELYRKFLKVRRYQMMALFDIENINKAVQTFWGEQAMVLDTGHGRVVVAPGRDLTDVEIALLQLYPRVLPVTPGIETRFHFGSTKVAGIGAGWGGLCEPYAPEGLSISTENNELLVSESDIEITTGPLTEGADMMCEIDVNPYGCF